MSPERALLVTGPLGVTARLAAGDAALPADCRRKLGDILRAGG